MRCSAISKLLSSYLDGELRAKDREHIDTHLQRCHHCSKKLQELHELTSMFAQAQRYEAPAGFSTKVMAKLDKGELKAFPLWASFTRFVEAAAILVAITAGIMSGGLLIDSISSNHKIGVVSALSLDSFETLPPQSLGRAYLAMTEERQ